MISGSRKKPAGTICKSPYAHPTKKKTNDPLGKVGFL
jgi:hypothetical protein